MSGKFTPGPWVVHVEPDSSIYRVPSVYICRSDEPWPDGQLARVNTADEFGSQEANANLIAAAPSLYEALNRLAEHIATGDDNPPRADALLAEANAALSKARGETA